MNERLDKLMRFFESDPSDAFTAYAIALEQVKAGDRQAALTWLDRALELDADMAYAYFQKAKILIGQGQADQARRILEDGLQAAGRSGDEKARRELGELLKTLG